MIDITMTALLRPEILKECLDSFCKNLFGNTSNYRLIINVDPVGEKVSQQEVIDVAKQYFSKIRSRTPKKAHFGLAAIWCWKQVKTKYLFHLEDDWKLIKKVDIKKLIEMHEQNPNFATINLLKRKGNKPLYKDNDLKYYIWKNKLSLHPCLCKSAYFKGILPLMNPKNNPELQIVRGSSRPTTKIGKYSKNWKHVYYNIKDNPVLEDLGIPWKIEHKFKRGVSAFVRYRKNG